MKYMYWKRNIQELIFSFLNGCLIEINLILSCGGTSCCCLSLHLLLFLSSIVLSHSVWIDGDTKTVEIKSSALIGCQNLNIPIFTPVRSPWVLHNPEIVTISLSVPTNNLDYVLSVKFESILSSVVNTILISQEICVNNHLCYNWTIL